MVHDLHVTVTSGCLITAHGWLRLAPASCPMDIWATSLDVLGLKMTEKDTTVRRCKKRRSTCRQIWGLGKDTPKKLMAVKSSARLWQLKYVLFSPRNLGKSHILTSIFFKGVETTNQRKIIGRFFFWPVVFLFRNNRFHEACRSSMSHGFRRPKSDPFRDGFCVGQFCKRDLFGMDQLTGPMVN